MGLKDMQSLKSDFSNKGDNAGAKKKNPYTGKGSEPNEYRQDRFDSRPASPDVHGAPPEVTVPNVINHIKNLYDHSKRLVDWVNNAAKNNNFSTRLELKHIETGTNEYATTQDPEAFDIILHADPSLLNFEYLSQYKPYGETKIGFHYKEDVQISEYRDEEGGFLKGVDGGRLKSARINHINLSSIIGRKAVPNEYQYANPMIQQGAELNASYYIKMIREEIIANTFKKIPVYKLNCGTHVHEGRIIQDYIDQKLALEAASRQQVSSLQPRPQVAPFKLIIPPANEANFYGDAGEKDFKQQFDL